MEKFNHKIPDLLEERKKKILEIFPELNSDGKINLDKLRDIFADDGVKGEKYDFTWSGKTQEMEKIKPNNKLTLKPVKEESVNFDETNNIYIEGDNIEALKLLLKSYYGKIKMIYIDPPYNTGNDFIYNDNYTEYVEKDLLKSGQIDEEGNVLVNKINKNGRRHSNWLSFMYSRLYVARQLLKDDGVIFISIDDNEVHNLRKVCDEIFGEENFMGNIVRSTGQTTGQDSGGLGSSFDYILVYTKYNEVSLGGLPLDNDDLKRFENEDEKGKFAYDQMRKTGSNDRREDRPNMYYAIKDPDGQELFPIGPNGYESRWRFEKKTYEKLNQENYIMWKKTKRGENEIWWPYVKYYLEGRTKRPSPLWTKMDGNKKASRDLRELFNGEKVFDFPKPIEMIKQLIQIVPNDFKEGIVLDFFAGSATTAHSIMQVNIEYNTNIKYILVQIPEQLDIKKKEDKPAIDFLNNINKPLNICEIGKERIRRAGKKILEENRDNENIKNLDIDFKVFKVHKTNFNIFDSDIENTEQLQQQLEIFGQSSLAADYQPLDVLYEVILKEGLMLDEKINQVEENIFIVADRLINLKSDNSKLELKYLDNIKVYIAIDSSFNGADSKKTNIDLQLKENNIVFKVL